MSTEQYPIMVNMPKKIMRNKLPGLIQLCGDNFTKQYVGIAKSNVDAQSPPIMLITLSIFGK